MSYFTFGKYTEHQLRLPLVEIGIGFGHLELIVKGRRWL